MGLDLTVNLDLTTFSRGTESIIKLRFDCISFLIKTLFFKLKNTIKFENFLKLFCF